MKTLVLLLALAVTVVNAQDYPSRPVRVIVPFPPGGTTDIVARLVADRLGSTLGQPAVIENRGGAGGAIGATEIARAAPDGYTLGIATVSTHGVNPAINPKLAYDALRDFTAISNLASVPNVVSAHPGTGIDDVKGLIEKAKASPGKITYASAGNGSLSHMLGELFKSATSTDLLHVPYKGVGPALNDTLGGQVNILFDNLPSSLPHIQSGKLRALAVSSAARLESLPNVPTFAEAGVPQLNDPSWFGLVGPARLPEAILARVHKAVAAALAAPDVRERMRQAGAVAAGNTPAEFAAQIRAEVERHRRVAAERGIRID
ncbi:MAG TPA: tripartite tricarboxylate transporter substrate binding protein BugE [Burkholderiales bacterium]|nr:tripartite tricarboxylate transporter substrate binding protein BugE [Burkholderiales bacterium]